MSSKAATVNVFGTKVTVVFSQYSDEYFECHTKAELRQAAKAEILARLNELAEVQNENALTLLEIK